MILVKDFGVRSSREMTVNKAYITAGPYNSTHCQRDISDNNKLFDYGYEKFDLVEC